MSNIIGCVGAILRSPEDLSQIIPEGKDYVPREKEEYPLWNKPLGVGLSTTEGSGAIELVRMAVHPDFRGKSRKFSVKYLREQGQTKDKLDLAISELLVLTVAKWAVEKHCKFVVLTTGRLMYRAVNAYKRLGFSGNELPENVAFSAEAIALIERYS